MKSFYGQQDKLIRIIDSGGWKHSWHLPKNERSGDIDWFSIDTHRKIVEVMSEKRKQAMDMVNLIDSIIIPPESDYE